MQLFPYLDEVTSETNLQYISNTTPPTYLNCSFLLFDSLNNFRKMLGEMLGAHLLFPLNTLSGRQDNHNHNSQLSCTEK